MTSDPDAARAASLSPIGIFDSGVGGLSVLREIRRALPSEDLLYAADSAYAPYGDRDPDVIQARALAVVRWLESRGAKAVVVACNTATGVAVDLLRERVALPIVAIEPAVKPAAALTRTGTVGVMATTRTLASPRFARLVSAHAQGVRIVTQACPGLVQLVEAGELASDDARALVAQYVGPLIQQGADVIVLGCTHYPFLTPLIAEAAGAQVTIVDPAVAVARELRRRLEQQGLLAGKREGCTEFWTTGGSEPAQRVIAQLGISFDDVQHVAILHADDDAE